ncbi:MAG: hypothetical protein DIU70_003605 [Bacillota bacterium]|nr:MAG: hypothetical protein DIU70_03960 [Bacillota bacterium]
MAESAGIEVLLKLTDGRRIYGYILAPGQDGEEFRPLQTQVEVCTFLGRLEDDDDFLIQHTADGRKEWVRRSSVQDFDFPPPFAFV